MTKDDQSASAGRLDADDLEKASLDTVYEKLSTSPEGLTAAEAKARIERYGRNELVEKEVSNLEKFLRFFWGPIAWMIEAAALLSLLMGHWADLTIILVLLFYNSHLRLLAGAQGIRRPGRLEGRHGPQGYRAARRRVLTHRRGRGRSGFHRFGLWRFVATAS